MKNKKPYPEVNIQLSDDELLEQVHGALGEETRIDPSEIKAVIKEGNVTLSGKVFKKRDSHIAELCAKNVDGVHHVQNNLKVTI